MVDVVKSFGRAVSAASPNHPKLARTILRSGWGLMGLKYHYLPDKRLVPSDQYLADMMMRTMRRTLSHGESCAIVNAFTACELLQEVGLSPNNAETFSSYLSGSQAEGHFIQCMDDLGISDTFCSYHKIFEGSAEEDVMPKPACIVHTNLVCDANLVSFRRLASHFGIPLFYIDVPAKPSEEAVAYVERQMHDLASFLEELTGKDVDDDSLRERVRRSQITMETFDAAQAAKAGKDVKTDLNSPLYCAMANNILLGTEGQLRFVQMLRDDVAAAGPKRGKHLYWMHVIPYWSRGVAKLLAFSDQAQISGDELGQCGCRDFDPDKPYEAMARRMVYNSLNGPVVRRIDAGIRHAQEMEADGVVWFNHWGCKHTIGASQLAKRRFEEAGIPCLVIDGDGCDRSHGGEGQTETRLEAFLEMLDAR